MKNYVLLFLLLMTGVQLSAQCPAITCPSTLSIPCSTTGLGQSFTATSSYSANITSQWFYSPDVPLWSTGTATSVISINHVGTYSVQFTDNVSGCVATKTIAVGGSANSPTFYPEVPSPYSYTLGCPSSFAVLHMVDPNTNPMSGGSLSFALQVEPGTPPVFNNIVDHTITTCGEVDVYVMDVNNTCISSFALEFFCPETPTVTIFGPVGGTICAGSSAVLKATGNAQNYLWDDQDSTISTLVTPATPGTFVYTVTAYNNINCAVGTDVYTLTVVDCLPTNTTTPTETVTAINENSGFKNNFSLFPNPASSQLTLKTNVQNEITYILYDIIGNEIAKGVFINSKTLNVSSFDNGTYLLKLQSGQESLYKKVIIKN